MRVRGVLGVAGGQDGLEAGWQVEVSCAEGERLGVEQVDAGVERLAHIDPVGRTFAPGEGEDDDGGMVDALADIDAEEKLRDRREGLALGLAGDDGLLDEFAVQELETVGDEGAFVLLAEEGFAEEGAFLVAVSDGSAFGAVRRSGAASAVQRGKDVAGSDEQRK